MTPAVNLHILAAEFTQLSRSAFFEPAFQEFSAKTAEVILHVLQNAKKYPEEVVRQFQELTWNILQFVSGSRSNDAPHETQYVLRKALKEWVSEDALVSSAALNGFEFFVNLADFWEFVDHVIDGYDVDGYSPLVVRIGSPAAFRHRPVFCVPLFHELGHFVDHNYKISEASVLLNLGPTPDGISAEQWQNLNVQHRMEHFADLFAACYCGQATNQSLFAIAPNHGDSPTHPATDRRMKVVDDFLAGMPNPMVDLLQEALKARKQEPLKVRFVEPSVECFNDVLTCKIGSVEELYGIFLSSWGYLHTQLADRSAPWITLDADASTIEKTVNDLTGKSIRNYEIVERWKNVTSD